MDSRPYLRSLGQPALFAPTGEPIRLKVKKHLGLLVYLAVEAGRPQRRDWLAEFFWPKADAAEARHSLSTALSALRARLGRDALEAGRDHVQLHPGRVTLDLERLLAGDILGDEGRTGPLEVAGFLDGFDLADAVEFAQWKDRQQARLLPVITAALVTLTDRSRRRGDFREVERLADRMLALDELSEAAIRAKMEARALVGDRVAALRAFEEWRAKLAAELHAAPSAAVEGLALRLRQRGWERATAVPAPGAPAELRGGRPFIGRQAEYRALYEAWESSRSGAPGHVLVLGDSGVGKTTLVERLTDAAALEGAAVSRVQCYDLEREIPYAALSTLVLGLLAHPGAAATPPESLAELARTVPDVRRRFPAIPPSADSQGETARIRLTESFLDLLVAIAEEHPVILVVDDVHLADDASLAVLHLTLRRARERPFMALFITRPGELPHAAQGSRLRQNARTLGVREISLPPLSEDESGELLRALIPGDHPQPTASERRALVRAAAGFPMALELLTQDWEASGARSLALSFEAMTMAPADGGQAAQVYQQVVHRITINPTTHNVLNLAAILGHRLNELGMYELVDLGVGQTLTGMAELVSRRILRDSGQGLEFVNELVRGSAYLAVPSPLRKVLHGQVAERLLRQDGESQHLGLEIAWHLVRAGRVQEAIPHLLQGTRAAIRGGALDTAERALTTALDILPASDQDEAALLLMEVLHEQGRWREVLATSEHRLSAHFRGKSALSRVLEINAASHLPGSDVSTMTDWLENLQETIQAHDNVVVRVRAVRVAASLVGKLRDPRSAARGLALARAIPTTDLHPEELGSLCMAKAIFLAYLNDRTTALAEMANGAALLDATAPANMTAARMHYGLGALSCAEGRYPEALRHLETAHRLSIRLGNDSIRAATAANLAMAHGRLGAYDRQLALAQEVLELSVHEAVDHLVLSGAYYAAFACANQGRSSEAIEHIRRAPLLTSDTLAPWQQQAWHLQRADVYFLAGLEREAKDAAIIAVTGVHTALHAKEFAGPYARWIAKLATTSSQIEESLRVVTGFREQLSSYDAIDRLEILCALAYLKQRVDMNVDELTGQIEQTVRIFHPAVSQQLSRLGFLGAVR